MMVIILKTKEIQLETLSFDLRAAVTDALF